MEIKDLKTFVVGNPAPHFGGRYFIFLKLITDDGIEGVKTVTRERLAEWGVQGIPA